EGLARPVLIGRPDIIAARIEKIGLRLELGGNCEVVNVLSDPRYREVWTEYYGLVRRQGVSQAVAKEETRSRTTLIGAMLGRRGGGAAVVCGTLGAHTQQLKVVRRVV